MIFAYYTFAAVLVYISYMSYRSGVKYLRYFVSETAASKSRYCPFASIIAPCKGVNEGLRENLAALLNQNFPAYEVIFVVDDENDPSVEVIGKIEVQSSSEIVTKLVIAPRATASSQKVENLREAVLHAAPLSQVFVFVDSDARPGREWLQNLVASLDDEKVGATTGYRWFISEKPTFWSELRSAWNASIASSLGPNAKRNFCWGGSTAIRREVFERLDIRERWRTVVSDDFTLTHAIKAAGLTIKFVPQALAASVGNCTFRELLEFTTRQMKIARVYAPRLWQMSLFGSMLFLFVMTASVMLIGFRDVSSSEFVAALVTLVAVTGFSIAKAWLRLRAVRIVLPEFELRLRRQTAAQLTLWAVTPLIFLYNSLAALISRRITWRGIDYILVSASETIVGPKR